MDYSFFVNSFLLGIGLAMDAFSVSIVNGMREPGMRKKKLFLMAGAFAFFQCLMPIVGWVLVRTVVDVFKGFSRYVPWIGFVLLLFIGGKMIIEGIREKRGNNNKVSGTVNGAENEAGNESGDDSDPVVRLTKSSLLVQSIATSIDALSVGFAISSYNRYMALVAGLIIGFTTFVICVFGGVAGKRIGDRLSGSASIFGGCILVIIGIKMLL